MTAFKTSALQSIENTMNPVSTTSSLLKPQIPVVVPLNESNTHRGKQQAISEWRGPPSDAYLMVRHRLDQLDYHDEYLHPSSISLVQRLVADLVQTTETARQKNCQLELAVADKEALNEQIVPLRTEITRLTAENNHLHRDLIAMADERDARGRRAIAAAKRIDNQAADLKFIASQYASRVENEQNRASALTIKADELFSKLGVVQTQQAGKRSNAMSKSEAMFQRLQKIDVETGLEPLDANPSYFVPPDPVIADIVRIAESQTETLQKAKADAEAKNVDLENEIALAREQLSKREREIQRLGVQLEIARSQQFGAAQNLNAIKATRAGSPIKGTSRTAGIVDIAAAKDRIEQLEVQIEYLQDHIDGLEKDLSEMESERGTLHSTYMEEKDKLAADLNNERKRSEALMRNLGMLESMIKELKLDEMNSAGKGATVHQPAPKEVAKHLKQIASLTDKVKSTKERLDSTTNRLNKVIQEKQELKNEIQKLKGGVSNADAETGKVSIATSTRDPIVPMKKYTNAEDTIAAATIHPASDKKALETDIKSLETELDRYKVALAKREGEYSALKLRLETLQTKLDQAEYFTKELIENKKQLLDDLSDSQRERDELVNALEKFGSELTGLQSHVKSLTSERDNMKQLYEQANTEVQRLRALRSEQRQGAASPSKTPTTEKVIDQQIEIDLLRASEVRLNAQVKSLQAEIEKLQTDLKATVMRQKETGISATEALTQLEGEVSEFKKIVSETETSKSALSLEIQHLKEDIDVLEDEKHDLQNQLERSQVRISQLEIETDREQFQLRDLRSKLTVSEQKITKLEDTNKQLKTVSADRAKLAYDHQKLLGDIDKERDQFQVDLDRKAEKIAQLNEQVTELKAEATRAGQEALTLREKLDVATQSMNQQDKELSSLQRQCDEISRDREHFESSTERLAEELRNIGSDLAALTRENQVLNAELVDASVERDKLRAELGEADRQLQYLDELIRTKDEEKDQLMTSYRKLISDYERVDFTLKASNEDNNNIKMEAIMRDKRVEQLQKALDETTQQVSQYKIDITAFEKQSNNLTRALGTAERNVRHLENERMRLNREIGVARDLAHTIDRSKDDFQKQLTAVSLENERLQHHVRSLETDLEALNNQIRTEKLKSERLEQLVAVERTRKIQTERSAIEIQASKGSLEGQLEALNEEQKQIIVNMTKQAEGAAEEIKALKARIQHLEKLLRDQHAAFSESERNQEQAKKQIGDLNQLLTQKDEILNDLWNESRKPSTSSPNGKTNLEDKISAELDKTQIQQRKYEVKIAQRVSELENKRIEEKLAERISPDSLQVGEDSVMTTSDDVETDAVVAKWIANKGTREHDDLLVDVAGSSEIKPSRSSVSAVDPLAAAMTLEPKEIQNNQRVLDAVTKMLP